VQPDQIVVREVQGNRCLQVFQLLAKRVGQARNTPMGSNSQKAQDVAA
jgi:hypothetical protein